MTRHARARKRRPDQQVPTVLVSIRSIMESREFARGFEDARRGIPFDWRIGADATDANASWHYERGRLFAHIAPLNMPLRISGFLNPKALALCGAAFKREFII